MSAADPIPQLIAGLKADRASFLKDGHKELFLTRAPSRIDVMGGISDFAGGLLCEFPLETAAAVAVQRRDDRKLVIKTYNQPAGGSGSFVDTVTLSLDDFYGNAALLPHEALQHLFAGAGGAATGKEWAAHIAGAFPMLARHKKITRRTHGANIACYSTVPAHADAGANTAVACATLWALMAAYHLILDPMEIAVLAQRIESQVAGIPGGVSGQAAAMLGRAGQIMLLECQPHELKGYIPVPAGFLIAGIYSGVSLPVGASYRKARVAAWMAQAIIARCCQDLGVKKDPTRGYLANVPLPLFEKYFRHILPESISGEAFTKEYGTLADRSLSMEPGTTYFPRAAAGHFLQETARTQGFAGHLRMLSESLTPDNRRALAEAAGKLMMESHASSSALMKLGCEQTDNLLRLLAQRGPAAGIYGARATGTGLSGTVTLLADDTPAVRDTLAGILQEYQRITGLVPALLAGTSAGASEAAPRRMMVSELD